jgi:hypothetical protein
MKQITLAVLSVIIAMFGLLLFSGGKENINKENKYPARVDLLMPPNERVMYYFKMYSEEYDIPLKYILKCAKLESNYTPENENYAPYEENLVSSADAFSVLQVRVIAAREVWRQYDYKGTNDKEQDSYRKRYGIPPTIRLEYLTDDELAHKLRYDLSFNIETGIRYMRFLKDKKSYSWAQVFSVYNQGWKGAQEINTYAKNISG